jgi:hypothetical protein
VQLILQAVPADGNHAPVLQQDGELPQAVIVSPKVEEVRHDLRADHLAPVKLVILRALGFVHIFADH